jgi:hypothetical protein
MNEIIVVQRDLGAHCGVWLAALDISGWRRSMIDPTKEVLP